MEILYATIKPGSVLLTKDYNWFKKGLAFITKKELPFNRATLFTEESQLLKLYKKHTSVIMELKKPYSKKEIAFATKLAKIVNNDPEITWVTGATKNSEDMFSLINLVRRDTFSSNDANINELLTSNYYKTIRLSEDANWNTYIL